MSKTRAAVLALVAFILGVAIVAVVARRLYREQVRSEFHLATHDGPTFLYLEKRATTQKRRKSRWAWAAREHLESRLRAEWKEMGYDDYWGVAFAIMRDPGWQSWTWSESMDQAAEDEMIRYLCFRVERGSTVWRMTEMDAELKALGSYPATALARHDAKLRRAFEHALQAPDDQIVFWTQDFLVARVEQAWAEGAAREHLSSFRHRWRKPSFHAEALRHILGRLRDRAVEGDPARKLLAEFAALYQRHREDFPEWNGLRHVGGEWVELIAKMGIQPVEE